MSIDITKVRAVIFDMDGLVVNSEPCWHIAEKIVFGKVGLNLSTEQCIETTGKPVKDVIQYWYAIKPWENPDFMAVETELFAEATKAIKETAPIMPGVLTTLEWAKARNYRIGLASASPMDMIKMVLEKFNLMDKYEFYHSAELEKFNKPDPAVYLTVAKNLNTPIEHCLILEDSFNGVKGAVASGAQVIAVPAKEEFEESKFDLANLKITSLEEIPDLFQA
ncbi:hexitol phosphatase HxpB [uncultured Arcticibacterium sp.]|uniref:hexitol phosphatase HxpB n=1 Tax=uncultured Arcticibacterium sp. TaxID=2173042 RepID=UPI0030F4BF9E